MMLGSLADAFGFTPDEVYRLTLPQIAAYGSYFEEKADMTEKGTSSDSSSTRPGSKTVNSLDDFIFAFGDEETKARWREEHRVKA